MTTIDNYPSWYQKKNRAKIRQYQKKWYASNRDMILAKSSKSRETMVGRLRVLLYSAKRRSISRNIPFNLTYEHLKDLWFLQNGQCALSGAKMELKSDPVDFSSKNSRLVSLDRIDSNSGYVSGNIQLVCYGVNLMKSDMNQDEFVNWCTMIANSQPKRTIL